jgi:hypothetical protein
MATADHGAPIAYLALEQGTSVLASDGARVGRVEHVIYDTSADIFEGVVLSVAGGRLRFADADEIADMYERAVLLRLDRDAAARLPEPVEPGDGVADRLRRAWDAISGRS